MATYMAFTPLAHAVVPKLNDKSLHLLAFGYLTGALWLSHMEWATPGRLFGVMSAYGILIELVQFFIPNRCLSGVDMLADALGIALALAGIHVSKVLKRMCPTE